jgi:hypothetical protein
MIVIVEVWLLLVSLIKKFIIFRIKIELKRIKSIKIKDSKNLSSKIYIKKCNQSNSIKKKLFNTLTLPNLALN